MPLNSISDFSKTDICNCDKLPPLEIQKQPSNELLTMKVENDNLTQNPE